MKTAKIILEDIKSESWGELGYDLFGNLLGDDMDEQNTYNKISSIFKYGEIGNIEIEVDEELNIIGGRIIPLKKQ